jgi:hypothetical protein
MTAMRSFVVLAVGVLVFCAVGILVPMATVPNGLDRYREDPAELHVGRTALETARRLNDAPAARLLLPAVKLEEVELVHGSCPIGVAGTSGLGAGEYTARVRTYTWFRIPARAIHLWCGGAGYAQIPVAPDTVPRIDVGPGPKQLPLPAVRIASARADLDRDGTPEELELRADVERADDGGLLWEDGHRWVVLVRDGDREDRLVDQFVPQGRLTAWVVEPEAGSPVVVVLMESGTAGIELRAFRHADRRGYVAAGLFAGNGRLIARLLEEAPADPAPRSPR